MAELWQRLRQRKMAQWALAYIAGAWVLLQALGLAADSFEWPRMVMRLAFGMAVVGFGVALVLAWYHGERGEQKLGGTELVILALLLAVGGGLLWQVGRERPAPAAIASPASGSPRTTGEPPSSTPPISAKSIAVLPFANLSADKDNAYFADGIQNEILTRLARIGALKVISHTSTQRYASSPDNLPEIARQLGVAHIVEGTVQKIGDSVRINVQLIEASTDAYLWAEIYDRKLVDVFSIQSEVAAAIATALQAKLTQDEQRAVALKPTDNVAAYDAYLRGLSAEASSVNSGDATARARDHYLEAIRLDPGFADAWAALVQVRSLLYFNFIDRTPAVLDDVRRAAEAVARLRPGSGEAALAQGYYRYRGLRDYPGALKLFEQALQRLPNDAGVLAAMSFLERRMGRIPQALGHIQRAQQIDPRNPQLLLIEGDLHRAMRHYPDARVAYDRALQFVPGDLRVLGTKVLTYHDEGDLDAAQQVLDATPPAGLNDDPAWRSQLAHYRLQRRFDLLLARCTELSAQLAEAQEKRAGSLNATHERTLALCIGEARQSLGNEAEARAAFRRVLELAKLGPSADDFSLTGALAVAYAGLGDKASALREAERGVALNQFDAWAVPGQKGLLARIHAHFGDADAALAILTPLLEEPNGVTAGDLRFGPVWDPIRKDPRFQKLIAAAESRR